MDDTENPNFYPISIHTKIEIVVYVSIWLIFFGDLEPIKRLAVKPTMK